jgi:hypothetical protein
MSVKSAPKGKGGLNMNPSPGAKNPPLTGSVPADCDIRYQKGAVRKSTAGTGK